MKFKVQIQILPNFQGKNDKERTIGKQIEIEPPSEEEPFTMNNIIQTFDNNLKKELDNRILSYYNHAQQAFINIGIYWSEKPRNTPKDIPDAKTAIINLKELVDPNDKERTIQLKFREKAKGEHSDALMTGQAEMSKGSRRTKERKIGEVILAVKKWRELYQIGEKDENGKDKQLSLEDAAVKVSISKKSLDDYFL